MKENKTIIAVNATAISKVSGGLLNILKQFLDKKNINDKAIYYVFTSTHLIEDSENIREIIVNNKGWIKRIPWDFYGLSNWFKSNKILPKYIISLQNNPVIFKGIQQYYYIQTPFPFVDFSWNVFNEEERVLWFYQKILPLFIKFTSTKNTNYIVQSKWMKNVVMERFNFETDRVMIVRPDEEIKQFKIENTNINNYEINLFYPASAYRHKNHQLLISILLSLKKINSIKFNKIKVHITMKFDLNIEFCKQVEIFGLKDKFNFMGYTTENKVFNYYKNCDALIFPSIMESFGLPLSEAKHFELPIIAIDLPYVYEAVGTYDKLITIKPENLNIWAQTIIDLSEGKINFIKKNNEFRIEKSWVEFHNLLA